PEKHAFQTQLFFLLERYRQQHTIEQLDLFSNGTVADYMFARDAIFAQVTLNPDEFRLYQQIYELLDRQLPRPDLVVYLEARPEVLQRHLRPPAWRGPERASAGNRRRAAAPSERKHPTASRTTGPRRLFYGAREEGDGARCRADEGRGRADHDGDRLQLRLRAPARPGG